MKHLMLALAVSFGLAARGAEFVVGVSVDGLGSSYLHEAIDDGDAPNFKRLLDEGAGTTNARTDYFMTITLPNHTAMLTGRPVSGADGHGWTDNKDPAAGATLHRNKGTYVASVFDVAHDHGLRTGLWTTKTKFSLYDMSYDATNGAADTVGPDDGRDKLDVFVHASACSNLTDNFIAAMRATPCRFAFVHFGDTDAAGHAKGWGGPEYRQALKAIDACLGRIMDLIAGDERMKGRSVLVLTADHGGKDKGHSDAKLPIDYTIPFYVWGSGVKQADLYALNAAVRTSPAAGRPTFDDAGQPIRNGDLGNLVLSELGFGAIPGSRINAKQDLRVRAAPAPAQPAAAVLKN